MRVFPGKRRGLCHRDHEDRDEDDEFDYAPHNINVLRLSQSANAPNG